MKSRSSCDIDAFFSNQSSVTQAWQEFDEAGRMKPFSFYERVVNIMKELIKFTIITRGISEHLTDRYSERKETAKNGKPAFR